MSSSADFERRLGRLEQDRDDRERLEAGVERLSDGVGDLNTILARVDEQQQRLRQMAHEVQEVKEKAVPREEIDAKLAQTRRERRRLVFSTAGLLSAVLGMGLFSVSQSAHDACERRQEATRTIITVLESFRNPLNTGRVDAGVTRLTATLNESCDKQYPLHWPF